MITNLAAGVTSLFSGSGSTLPPPTAPVAPPVPPSPANDLSFGFALRQEIAGPAAKALKLPTQLLFVHSIEAGSPIAQEGKIRVGDVLLAVDGRKVENKDIPTIKSWMRGDYCFFDFIRYMPDKSLLPFQVAVKRPKPDTPHVLVPPSNGVDPQQHQDVVDENRDLKELLKERDNQIEELHARVALLEKSNQDMVVMKQRYLDKERDLGYADSSIDGLKISLMQRDKAIEERDVAIRERDAILIAQHQKLGQLQIALAERDEEIKKLHQQAGSSRSFTAEAPVLATPARNYERGWSYAPIPTNNNSNATNRSSNQPPPPPEPAPSASVFIVS